MEFHVREATGSAPVEVGLYAVSSDYVWEESTVNWNNAQVDIGEQYATARPGNSMDTVYDITDLVKAWQNGNEDAAVGFMLKSSNEISVDKSFCAAEHSTASYRPYVVMDYTYRAGSLNCDVTDVDEGANKTLSVLGITGTPTWTSSDTSIATVSSDGVVTGVKVGTVTITATMPGYEPLTCTVYVTVADGVYYFGSNTGLYLAVDGGFSDGDSVKLLSKKTAGPAKIRQLWKIQYVGRNSYSIRSLYKLDMALSVDNKAVNLACIGDSGTVSQDARWKIFYEESGYAFHYPTADSYEQCMRPDETNVVISTFIYNHPGFVWTLTPDTSVVDQVLLLNTQLGLPAQNAVRFIYSGTAIPLSELNLTATFVSQHTNIQNVVFEPSNEGIVEIDSSAGTITGLASGESVITARVEGCSLTASFVLKVVGQDQYATGIRIATINGKQYYDYTTPINALFADAIELCANHRCMSWEQYCEWALDISILYDVSIVEHEGMQLGSLLWFHGQVNHGRVWDIKLLDRWTEALPGVPYLGMSTEFVFRGRIITAEDAGNIMYGYTGRATGFGEVTLYWGGGVANQNDIASELATIPPFYGDNENDHYSIELGINLFNADYPDYPEVGYNEIPVSGWLAELADVILGAAS